MKVVGTNSTLIRFTVYTQSHGFVIEYFGMVRYVEGLYVQGCQNQNLRVHDNTPNVSNQVQGVSSVPFLFGVSLPMRGTCLAGHGLTVGIAMALILCSLGIPAFWKSMESRALCPGSSTAQVAEW